MNFKTLNRLRELHDRIVEKDTEILMLDQVLESLVEQDGQTLKLSVIHNTQKPIRIAKGHASGSLGEMNNRFTEGVMQGFFGVLSASEMRALQDEMRSGDRSVIKREIPDLDCILSNKSAIIFLELHLKEVKNERAVLMKYADECTRSLHASLKDID